MHMHARPHANARIASTGGRTCLGATTGARKKASTRCRATTTAARASTSTVGVRMMGGCLGAVCLRDGRVDVGVSRYY